MNFADPQTIITTLGWSLIHFLWQGSLITLLYWVITRSIQSIQAKYWTGMSLVLLSLAIPILNNYQASNSANEINHVQLTAQSLQSYHQLNLENLLLYFVELTLPYFVLIWAMTVSFLSFRLVKSWLTLASIKHECDPQISSQLKQYVKNISIKLDLATIPLLKVSKQVMVPAAYGVLKPTVLLPLSLISQIPKDQLEAIIKHELCHLKRNDFVHNIIQLCADILLFFHPGIRWMNNDIRHIREQCCDQMVLSHQTEAITYAKALTNIASFTNGFKLKHSVHLGINDGMLLHRVKFLLQNKSSQSSLMIFMPIIMLILLTTLLLQPKLIESEGTSLISNNALNQKTEFTVSSSNRSVTRNINRNNFYPTEKTNRLNDFSTRRSTQPNSTNEPVNPANNNSINQITSQLNFSRDRKIELEPEIQLTTYNEFLIPDAELINALKLNDLTLPPTINQHAKNTSQTITKELSLQSFDNSKAIAPLFKKYFAPTYPQSFWYNQIEQDVIATFRIKPNGKAYDISVSSQINNHIAFEQEVVKAIKKWKFETASLNQSTLLVTYQQIFSFTISDEVEKKCKLKHTGSRLKKAMPCNK